MGLTIIATHPKGFALMIEDLQLRITVNLTINGSQFMIGWGEKPASTIGWGAKPVFMIGWEDELMKSQTIGWKRWSIHWFLMSISCVELLNIDTHYNLIMKGQVKHVRSPIHS
jgi:hypothetical protein